MAESAAYHTWKDESEEAAWAIKPSLVGVAQLIKDPGAADKLNQLVARRRAELTSTLARYPGGLTVNDAFYPIGSSMLGYDEFVKHADDSTVGPVRDTIVATILQSKYTSGNSKKYFDALLAYKADESKTEPIELGSSKNAKARRSMHLCIAAVGLESAVGADEVTVHAGKSKIERQRAPDPVRPSVPDARSLVQKFIKSLPGATGYREQLNAFKADASRTTYDLASSADNRLRAQLHELVRDVGGLTSDSRVDAGGRTKTVVVTKISS